MRMLQVFPSLGRPAAEEELTPCVRKGSHSTQSVRFPSNAEHWNERNAHYCVIKR